MLVICEPVRGARVPGANALASGHHLTCLHGRHRIQAAREILPPTDAWWAVDLYLADAHPELRTTLVEEYANEAKPSDGEIYRKVWQYEREGNVCFTKRWKAHLSDHGRRGLRQLRDHGDGDTLHKLFNLRCDEEAQHNLELIRTTMHRIFRLVLHKDKTALQRVDQVTIKALELRVPRYSRRDAQVLQGQVLSGQICSLFSREEREAIWRSEIPSRLCRLRKATGEADAQRYRPHGARAEFPYTDEASGRHVVEVAESVFVDRSGPAVDRFDLGYRHLWAFAMREYLEVRTDAKKKSKDLLAKVGVQRADEKVLSRAANLAYKIGFVSDEIQALRERSSDREIAYNALLKARKPGRYQYDQTVLEANIAHLP
ncbi:hypothetical protein B7494_g7958 [Chlorociboria aeruginascens]|nr:hypothetical protein B7494_g7958 [Chlorociboria aeruginascens]